MTRPLRLRLALCAAGALATLGLAACGAGEHGSPGANAASATTSAATAPAEVRNRSGHVFPGEGAQVPPRTRTARASRSAASPSRSTSGGSTSAGAPAAASAPATGRYVGPPHNGANPCGYVAVGPGLEQASAFVVHGVDCATARTLAADKRHLPAGSRSYSALGFDCVSASGSATLRRFNCTAGAAAVSFIVS
jgi:hypothetical protein